jgi:hypothetical protein
VNLGETSRLSCGSHDFGRAGRTARFGIALLLLASPAVADSHVDCSIEGACCFPRRSVYGSARSVNLPDPRLATIAAITVADGPLSRPVVKRVLANRTAALGACASEHGELRSHIVIGPSGAAQVTRITGSFAVCAGEALRATKFPVTTGVTELDVRVTW